MAHGTEQSELGVVYLQLEEGPATDDLQPRQADLVHVHVGYEDIAGDLAYVLQEAEVEAIVEPRDLQVAIDVGTVGVPVAKVSIVMLLVRGH